MGLGEIEKEFKVEYPFLFNGQSIKLLEALNSPQPAILRILDQPAQQLKNLPIKPMTPNLHNANKPLNIHKRLLKRRNSINRDQSLNTSHIASHLLPIPRLSADNLQTSIDNPIDPRMTFLYHLFLVLRDCIQFVAVLLADKEDEILEYLRSFLIFEEV